MKKKKKKRSLASLSFATHIQYLWGKVYKKEVHRVGIIFILCVRRWNPQVEETKSCLSRFLSSRACAWGWAFIAVYMCICTICLAEWNSWWCWHLIWTASNLLSRHSATFRRRRYSTLLYVVKGLIGSDGAVTECTCWICPNDIACLTKFKKWCTQPADICVYRAPQYTQCCLRMLFSSFD
jgi:hypothetical protein